MKMNSKQREEMLSQLLQEFSNEPKKSARNNQKYCEICAKCQAGMDRGGLIIGGLIIGGAQNMYSNDPRLPLDDGHDPNVSEMRKLRRKAGLIIGGQKKKNPGKKKKKLNDWQKFVQMKYNNAENILVQKRKPHSLQEVNRFLGAVWKKSGKNLKKALCMISEI